MSSSTFVTPTSSSTSTSASSSRNVKRVESLRFPWAEQADILRRFIDLLEGNSASQKDEYYRQSLRTKYFDTFRQLFGPRLAMNHKEELNLVSDFTYFGLTSASGQQTLGEEYCDIMQLNHDNYASLRVQERILLILFHILIPYTLNKLNAWAQSLTRSESVPSHADRRLGESGVSSWTLTSHQRQIIAKLLPRLISFVSILKKVHVAIFFFSGEFYHLSKRALNIRYIFIRPQNEQKPSYSILGLLIFAQIGISLLLFARDALSKAMGSTKEAQVPYAEVDKALDLVSPSTAGNCPLCLNTLKNPTATLCGHLFCWHCIVEWSNTKLECPMCRATLKKNDLVCVYGV